MIRHLAGIAWHLGGMFILPFVLGFVAALFLEVSEVGETLPALLAIALVLLAPLHFASSIFTIFRSMSEWS